MGSIERSTAGSPASEADRTVRRLQADLLLSERRLHAALSDVTAANSQLRASNDDQRELNEELRSAVEELKTSENELQALNGELGSQVDALVQANLDMHGVIESTRIALVFLDQSLRIRSFTPAMRDVLPLRDADRGRAVTDLQLLVDYPGFAADARHVLRTHEAIDRHAGSLSGCTQYLVRLLPHRDRDDQVAGLVVTFLDVSATVRAEQALGASDERFPPDGRRGPRAAVHRRTGPGVALRQPAILYSDRPGGWRGARRRVGGGAPPRRSGGPPDAVAAGQ